MVARESKLPGFQQFTSLLLVEVLPLFRFADEIRTAPWPDVKDAPASAGNAKDFSPIDPRQVLLTRWFVSWEF